METTKQVTVSTNAVMKAIKWVADEITAGNYRDRDWHGAIYVWDNGAITASLKYGQIDTAPRPFAMIKGVSTEGAKCLCSQDLPIHDVNRSLFSKWLSMELTEMANDTTY